MSKVPIDTLPVELRIKIYELGDVETISTHHVGPWGRTIIMSGILNDNDAIEIAAIQGRETRRIMCDYIALSGNLPMMMWARSDKSSSKDDAAVEERSMKQIRLTPFPWDTETCSNAAKYGHLKLLKWLHEQGCPWNSNTFQFAAYFGNLEMLEWLYQMKCPWGTMTFSQAAESEDLNLLKWLYERKCPWDGLTFSIAVSSGNLEMVEWLHEQKCPSSTQSVLRIAAGTGDLALVKWIVHRGYPTNEYACASAADNGHLEILKWLREQGCPWDSCMSRDVHGTKILVRLQQNLVI
jgi:hypothetical protein